MVYYPGATEQTDPEPLRTSPEATQLLRGRVLNSFKAEPFLSSQPLQQSFSHFWKGSFQSHGLIEGWEEH